MPTESFGPGVPLPRTLTAAGQQVVFNASQQPMWVGCCGPYSGVTLLIEGTPDVGNAGLWYTIKRVTLTDQPLAKGAIIPMVLTNWCNSIRLTLVAIGTGSVTVELCGEQTILTTP